MLEDQHYTVSVSLTISNGSYTVTNTASFSELTTGLSCVFLFFTFHVTATTPSSLSPHPSRSTSVFSTTTSSPTIQGMVTMV